MNNTILQIGLGGGLCNKLFHLFSACDIAIKNNIKILEPYFGWKKKILFSDIYDINFFNEEMKKFNKGQDILISRNEENLYTIKKNNINLWNYSEKILTVQRKQSKMNSNCMNIIVLQALKLNKSNENIVNSVINIENKNALHIRIESDWINYAKGKELKSKKNELFLINIDTLINLYKNRWSSEDVFFTVGQKQNEITKKFTNNKIDSQYIFNNELEYEINAAINFELCCKAKRFIGLSRSTFSNLISLKRSLLNKDDSFIYNLKHKIVLRIDKGLQCDPVSAITKKTNIQ